MRKKLFLIPLTLSVVLFCSCDLSSIKNKFGHDKSPADDKTSEYYDDDSDNDRDYSRDYDRETSRENGVAPITRDIEFMIFMHRFASDYDFQMSHINFPIGKLTYAYDMDKGRHDSFKKCYWLMQDMTSLSKYFKWKNNNKIVYYYDASMAGSEIEFLYTYTFEKINGDWYVTKGDYSFSDVGIPEYTAEMAAESQAAFRKEHRGSYPAYTYRGTPGEYPEASERILTERDLRGMSKADLRLMRNEIFARHGYAFESKDLRDHFESQRWYYPLFKNVTKQLSSIEEQNVKFIQAHER